MPKRFSNLNPQRGDTKEVLLGRLLQKMGGSPSWGDTKIILLAKILLAFNPVVVNPVADFVARAGITSQPEIDAVQVLVEAAIANGWWDKCDLIYPFVGGTALAHSQNLKSASYTIAWAGTVTHDANGITGDGTTGYGDTTYDPATGPLWSLNSAHVAVYRRSTGTFSGGNRNFFGTLAVELFRTFFDANISARINAEVIATAINTSLALMSLAKLNSTGVHLYWAGTDADSAAVSMNAVPSASLYVLAKLELSGHTITPSSFIDANIAGMTAGSGLTFAEYTLMAADWQAFNTSLGRAV